MHLLKLVLPMLSVGVALATTCSNGLPGVEKSGVCCVEECGTCGGIGCGDRGGLTKYECCTGSIEDSGVVCGVHGAEAPCLLEAVDSVEDGDPTCANGVTYGDVCCLKECETCGGIGCGSRNGLSGDECCTGKITAAGNSCDEHTAPCLMSTSSGTTTEASADATDSDSGETTPASASATSCGGDYSGVYCCNEGCGECGGVGCGKRGDGCCTSDAKLSMCSVTGVSPCTMDSALAEATTDTTDTVTVTDGTTPASASATSCSGDYSGVYCCNEGCGECGGVGCGKRGDGCCTSDAKLSMCSVTGVSPCTMDSALAEATTDTTDTVTVADGTTPASASATSCGGDYSGVYCCNEGCGECGGIGCGKRGDGCCTSDAKLSMCSVTGVSPCTMDSEPTYTTGDTVDVVTVSEGTTPASATGTSCGGVSDGLYCCNDGCGVCGGVGCGLLGDGCCTSDAADSLCSETLASPCMMASADTTTTTDKIGDSAGDKATIADGEASTATSCGGVAQGLYCCKAECGDTCGGSGCGDNGDRCCTSDITELCSDTGMAPCIMGSVTTVNGETTAVSTTSFTSTCTDYDQDTVEIDIKKDGGICYIRGGGCATLTDIYNAQGGDNDGEGPLFVLDSSGNKVGGTPTGYWLLARNVRIEEDSLLQVHGSAAGGDAEALRIQSNGGDDYYEVRGHGGSLSFKNTLVTSWDTDKKEPQLDYDGGRSFLNCISEVLHDDDCSTNDMGECRMDIIESEMGHLGHFDSESYGLCWKVRGYCEDKSNPEVFDRVQVRGDIYKSKIYGMYYGHYTYGHEGGTWTYNEMYDNVQYGFDPHDDSDNLEIAYNKVWGNGNHGIIASKRCNNVHIHHNEVWDGGEDAVGIFLHRSSDDAEVHDNHVHDMQDAGMALMESMNAHVYDNVFENVKYGVRLSLGCTNNLIEGNTFDKSDKYGIYTYMGNDEAEASEDWDGNMMNNEFVDNYVHGGLKIQDNVGITFKNNNFIDGDEYRFERSTGIVWLENTVPDNTCFEGDEDSGDFDDYSASDMPNFC